MDDPNSFMHMLHAIGRTTLFKAEKSMDKGDYGVL